MSSTASAAGEHRVDTRPVDGSASDDDDDDDELSISAGSVSWREKGESAESSRRASLCPCQPTAAEAIAWAPRLAVALMLIAMGCAIGLTITCQSVMQLPGRAHMELQTPTAHSSSDRSSGCSSSRSDSSSQTGSSVMDAAYCSILYGPNREACFAGSSASSSSSSISSSSSASFLSAAMSAVSLLSPVAQHYAHRRGEVSLYSLDCNAYMPYVWPSARHRRAWADADGVTSARLQSDALLSTWRLAFNTTDQQLQEQAASVSPASAQAQAAGVAAAVEAGVEDAAWTDEVEEWVDSDPAERGLLPLAKISGPVAWMYAPENVEAALTSAARLGQHHPRPTNPADVLMLGVSPASSRLAQSFQRMLYKQQHPTSSECASVKWYINLQVHSYGAGSFYMLRNLQLLEAIRWGRVYVSMPDQGWRMTFDACTEAARSWDGCVVENPTPTSPDCKLPDNWRELVAQEQAAEEAARGPRPLIALDANGLIAPDAMDIAAAYYGPRRFLTDYDVFNPAPGTVDTGALRHLRVKLGHMLHTYPAPLSWAPERLAVAADQLPHLRRFRHQPACWWYAQAASYLLRPKASWAMEMLTLIAESLRLPQPAEAARIAFAFPFEQSQPARAVPAIVSDAPETRTPDWWSSLSVLKMQWQWQQLMPGVFDTLHASELQHSSAIIASGLSASSSSVRPILSTPLLGYLFVRAGDKRKEEPSLAGLSGHLNLLERAYGASGIRQWWIASDELRMPARVQHILTYQQHASVLYPPVDMFRSSAAALHLQYTVDRAAAAGGQASVDAAAASGWQGEISDPAERRAAVVATLVEYAVCQLADMHIGALSSNQNRLCSVLAAAPADDRLSHIYMATDTAWHVGTLGVEERKLRDCPFCQPHNDQWEAQAGAP